LSIDQRSNFVRSIAIAQHRHLHRPYKDVSLISGAQQCARVARLQE
jgi:hypothetical protein